MDNTWHARGTGLCPSDPRLQKNGLVNKTSFAKNLQLRQGGLKFRFTPLRICRGCPRGRGFDEAIPNVMLVTGVPLPRPEGLYLRVGRPPLILVQAGWWS